MNGQYPVTYANTGTGAQYMPTRPGIGRNSRLVTTSSTTTRGTGNWSRTSAMDGGRALALPEDTEYVVYMENPGTAGDPIGRRSMATTSIGSIRSTGSDSPGKFKRRPLHGSPPDKSHDWVLHVVREGRVEGMNKSYKFESRDIVLQDVESNSPKVPFTVEQQTADLHVRVSPPFAAKLTKETRATRTMMWLAGEVSADGQGYRVLATGQKGVMRPLAGSRNFPAVMHLRVYGMNANGKVYAIDRAFGLEP